MKRTFTLLAFVLAVFALEAQTPYVSISQINFIDANDLANCNDTTTYLGDTVVTRGIVIIDGGLSEVASGSVQGGLRPFIHVVDTANGGAMSPWSSIEIMGVIDGPNGPIPHPNFIFVTPGDVVEITGIVGEFNGSKQLSLLDGNSFNILSTATAPTAAIVPLADLNDPNRINQLATGEQWEGTFAKIENVTVSEVVFFSGGSRVSFDIIDGNGNKMNVSDRYLAQKLPSHQVLNANSPNGTGAGGPGTGTFIPPVPGTFYNSISGVIRHDANGCTGDNGRGYEINPFLDAHYDLGFAPPYIANVDRDPLIPTSNQSPDVTMNITDFDGTVDSVSFWYSSDPNVSPSNFTQGSIGLVAGTTDEYETTIPNFPDGTLVRYYIYAEDNDGNPSYIPAKPLNQVEPNFDYYTVRDNGLLIPDVQFSLAPNGDSPFVGETVTVTGYATSSTKPYDLGYVYIQDPNYSEWAGIALRGTNALTDIFRGEEVTVTGEVVESFGFTMLDVLSVNRTGNVMMVPPVSIDPGDSAAYASGEIEKYEGMLIQAELSGSKIWITEEDLGFGDYAVSSQQGAALSSSMRVLAGRQSTTSQSSLYVSPVTDTVFSNVNGIMEVTAIAVSDTMNMDAVVGVVSYGFSNYRILPRNNDDFIGINIALDTTALPGSPFSIEEMSALPGVTVYPNPNSGSFRVGMESVRPMDYRLLNFQGQIVREGDISRDGQEITVYDLPNGMYFLLLDDSASEVTAVEKIIIRK